MLYYSQRLVIGLVFCRCESRDNQIARIQGRDIVEGGILEYEGMKATDVCAARRLNHGMRIVLCVTAEL